MNVCYRYRFYQLRLQFYQLLFTCSAQSRQINCIKEPLFSELRISISVLCTPLQEIAVGTAKIPRALHTPLHYPQLEEERMFITAVSGHEHSSLFGSGKENVQVG